MENNNNNNKINSNNNNNSSQNPNPFSEANREEGELSTSSSSSSSSSSSDDDDNPVSSATPAATTRPTSVPPWNKLTQSVQASKAAYSKNPANSSDVLSRPSVQSINNKSFEKNGVPLKSANPGWHVPPGVPPGANTNLVISFSDDDTGSGSEDHRPRKSLQYKRNTAGSDSNQRPPLLLAKSYKLEPAVRNVNKVMSKKSLSRTFGPTTTKMNGGTHSRVAGSSSVSQVSRVRKFGTVNRNLSNLEYGSDQGQGLNNSKLRDLREQIALRERELKLKAAQQNKESALNSGRDHSPVSLGSDSAIKANVSSVGVQKVEAKEHDKKRLKVTGSYPQLAANRQQEMPSLTSSILLKEQALRSNSLHDLNMGNHGLNASPRRTGSRVVNWKKQDDKQMHTSAENLSGGLKEGLGVNINHIQTERCDMQVDPCILLNQTAPITINSSSLLKNSNSLNLNPPVKSGGHQPTGTSSKTSNVGQHLINGEYHEGISNDSPVDRALNHSCQASLENGSMWNYFGALNVSEHNKTDMYSLVEMEESLDKELEEAQEQRRICEIEERNALKAYRKAQRGLVEANTRCAELYRKREIYSAHFRSFFLNDSNLLWSTAKHEHVGGDLNHTNNVCRNLELMPTSSQPDRPDYDGPNHLGRDSNIQCARGASLNTHYRHASGQNLGSEPCSEPDASTSVPLHLNHKNAANITSSPSIDPNFSADEDEETSPLGHETMLPNYKNELQEQTSTRNENGSVNQSTKISSDCSPDSLTLEASLRSELFARLGRRILSKNSGSFNLCPPDEPGTENENGSEKTQTSNGSVLLSEAERNQEFDVGGNYQPERDISGVPINVQNEKKDDNEYCSVCHLSETDISSPTLVLRSAFGHLRDTNAVSLTGLQSQKGEREGSSGCISKAGYSDSGEVHRGIIRANSVQDGMRDICGKETGSFTCELVVDPFWPLCMYELRGKCNNDQCPWQHVRDFYNGNVDQLQHENSESSDCQLRLTPNHTKYIDATKLPHYRSVLTLPTYLVGLDTLKSDPHPFDSVIALGNGQYWQKSFSVCIALSNLLQNDLSTDEHFLDGIDGRIEVQGIWDKPLSYFQSRNCIVSHLNQMLPSNLQSLEMAFLTLSQEVNKLDGLKKALSILSRAIEVDPNSEILWISYLLIYYGNAKSIAKDDMFSYAVKQNDGCYVLWLMYINSRKHVDDRLVAYDAALTALCQQLSACVTDKMCASACILDMFLQMMDFFHMSGNVEKAIQKICGLIGAATNSDQHCSLQLSDILACLTISDKCMFWVCCIYLVIYRKLPAVVVHKFESDKNLLEIEWPRVCLLDEDKQRATKLVEMAMDFVKLYVNSESLITEADHRSVQYFAFCHVKCVTALDGLERCWSLLDEYMKQYPFCLEFVLVSARVQMTNFEGFEEALRKWPTGIPGIHCIWNQYIECVLQRGDLDLAKELIIRWYDLFSRVQCTSNGKLNVIGSGGPHVPLELASRPDIDFLTPSSDHLDLMFGYLNLSLFKILHDDHIGARNAIDRAFKASAPPYFEHCLREHAMFLLMNESQLKEAAFSSQHVNVLNAYLDDACALQISEPLSRRFLGKIAKPRVKQLISNRLSPVSSDFSIVNLVLGVWYGPSLLPKTFRQPKELVDFVEGILEIVPSNYQLAFSACKLLSKGENFIDITSSSMLYWASTTLVNAIFHAIPIAPEYIWVDSARILDDIADIESISERFYRKALSVYPFSIKLWNCYYKLCKKIREDASFVLEAARDKGIELD